MSFEGYNLHNRKLQMNRVFVYGTLKNGQPNHFRLMDPGSGTSTFVGQGQTLEKYPLVIDRSWNLPCLLKLPGSGLVKYSQ